MIEFFDGEDLSNVRSVMFTEQDIKELRYALLVQRNKCRRLALQLRSYIRDRDTNNEPFVTGIIERHEAVEQAQYEYSKLQRLILAQSVWVPKD